MLVLKFHIRVFFANKEKFMNQLKESLNSATEMYENKISILYDWNSRKREKRPLSSVYTNNNVSELLKNDIQSFIDSKKMYMDNNILYKRNYLLYGKPGTGKSSLIFALASEFNYKIRIINLKSIKSVSEILQQITNEEKVFYVFEDVDALSTTLKEREDKPISNDAVEKKESPRELVENNSIEGLNLSDILNVMDGLYTPEGLICFFTTNHIEKLDKAFLRDGRMDCKVEMDDLDNKTANQMIKDKLGYDGLFTKKSINPATLQELIIQVIWNKISIEEFKEKIN